ncbi:MAG: cellulase family glycosylhydrolase, partial [Alistipes sp.]|nr:cellulase family glycosylhydrolase [Alistipes sp.]
ENNKWKKIAIIETIVVAVVVVFIAGFFLGKSNNPSRETKVKVAQESSDSAVGAETTAAAVPQQETTAKTGNEQPSGAADQKSPKQTFEVTPDKTGLKLSFELTQDWGDDKEHFYSYTLVVENTGSDTVEEWAAKLPVSDEFSVNSSWNTECSVEDGFLYIEPVEFNKTLEAGASSDSIGIIMTYQTEPDFENAVIGSKADGGEKNGDKTSENKENTTKTDGKKEDVVTDFRGKLSVKGTNLVDKDGNTVQLHGVSTHGIAWFPDYVNYESFKTLRDEFGANVVRLAMYTAENGGYCTDGNKDSLKKLVNDGVSYATQLDMYVIIDWHILSDNNPNTYKTEALAFFDEMSKKHADNDHVIYEICNEPNGGTSWEEVKSYAAEVIAAIRKNDKDAVILVGTPTWCQDVDKAAASPLEGDNLMYVFHFYAATHKDDLRNRMKAAIDGGLPVFISEFSICDASGNGGLDYDSAGKWLDVINEYGLSYVGWSLSNKAESASILKSSCNKTSGYTRDDLSDSGKWLTDSFQ